MPIYHYHCSQCSRDNIERQVSIDERDGQICECNERLERKIVFTGSVWAPSSTGGHKV